ncbi:hypothetical protein [Flavobacterium frigoris]|uniref:Uncharacterized protein n=1 Tax=Flavobacterium frigoris TaxID=229204 RepID=A0A1H9HU84_FLAFI|nr:hypothetical protein [Flavobacterium frigoris]SEQ65913.1 hypothetical protein SAMN05444355_103258 [Flavobacterium frigoris]
MQDVINDLTSLFEEAKQKSEFDFVLILINYKGMGTKKLTTNLHEWFEAIEFYKQLYTIHSDKEKTRVGTLIYSTFFENSDFYNIIGSLCKIKLGQKGSSYLFWKTKKYERLLGIGEKQDFLVELLDDAGKRNIIAFFNDNHHKEIRNTYFHSAYSLSDEDYKMHDSETISIGGVGRSWFNIDTFLNPKIDNVIIFFDTFKKLYLDSFDSYIVDKEVTGFFPNESKITILGSDEGLKGFRIKNAVQFYGEWHDSGIWYEEEHDIWAGNNINVYFQNVETIEIREQITRYENKADINKNDSEFYNLIDKIKERQQPFELQKATHLLLKFGSIRDKKMSEEENQFKKQSYPKVVLPYYQKAIEIGPQFVDIPTLTKRIAEIENNYKQQPY